MTGEWDDDPPQHFLKSSLPLEVAWTSWVLSLIKTALERDRADDAANFLDRLRRRRLDMRELLQRRSWDEARSVLNVFILAEVYLGGWCAWSLQNGRGTSCEEQLLRRIVAELPSRELIALAWEANPQAFLGGGLIDAGDWERQEPMRSGIVYSSSGPSWPVHGLISMLLASSTEVDPDVSQEPLSDRSLADEVVWRHVTSILSSPKLSAILAGEELCKADDAADAVAAFFRRRRLSVKLRKLRHAVEHSVRPDHLLSMQLKVHQKVHRARSLTSALHTLQVSSAPPSACFLPAYVRRWMPVVDLLEGDDSSVEEYANAVALQWERRWVQAIERFASVTGACEREEQLPEQLTIAADGLWASRCRPNMIILPQQQRFEVAVLGRRLAGVPNRGTFGIAHVGSWNNIEVFRSPYPDISTALVVDTRMFFTRLADEEWMRLEVEDANRQANHNLLKASIAASDDTDVPDDRAARVLVLIRYFGREALGNRSAAAAVNLNLAYLGYVVPKGSDLYHRPGCDAATGPGSTLAHPSHLDDDPRRPCPRCRPDQWDNPLWRR